MSLAPLLALHEALQEAEQFVAGFEHDPHQDTDVVPLLKKLRDQVNATLIAIEVARTFSATQIATASITETREAPGLRGAA
ncbi:hypothetical protein [Delftia sp. WSY_7]|uniref:hypothetical protein n=1 Tax=Delftia sp. WSY_7 TaxID=3367202 RepID=UPI00370B1509